MKFIGAETIFFIRDMLELAVTDTLIEWLDHENINIRRYAMLLLGFIEENRGGNVAEKLEPGKKSQIIRKILEIIAKYKDSKNTDKEHVIKHAKMSLSVMGVSDYKEDLKDIIINDNDYTHRWYALSGVEKLIKVQLGTCEEFLEVLNKSSYIEGHPEIRRLVNRIHENYCSNDKRVKQR